MYKAKTKICVFTVTQPSKIFGPDQNLFMALLVKNYLDILLLPSNVVFIPPRNEVRGDILESPCPSVRLSVCPSVRPSVCRRAQLGKIARLGKWFQT